MRLRMTALIFLAAGALFAYPPLPTPGNEEEALLVRRIIDLWNDKDYTFAKSELKNYLKNSSNTPFSDHFWAMLGDLALKNKSFDEALSCYEHIQEPPVKECIQIKKWQALYQKADWAQLYEEISAHHAPLEDEGRFYFAESTFRGAGLLDKLPEGKELAHQLYEKALPLYATLLSNSAYAHHAKLAMAEIYRLLHQHRQAASLYLEIAEEEKNKEILFHAACVLLECDKIHAKEIFRKIAKEECAHAGKAACHWLILLAEQKEWDTIFKEREFFTTHLETPHLALGYFYLGLLNYERKNYQQALVDLQKCVGQELPLEQEKQAVIALLAAAKKLRNTALCEEVFAQIDARFPELQAEATSLLASLYRKKGDTAKALALYHKISEEFPETPYEQKARIRKIQLFLANHDWQEAHNNVLACLEGTLPENKRAELVRLAIHISLSQLAEKEVYEQLAADIALGLEMHLFYKEEKIEKEALLAKAYLKLGKFEEALSLLKEAENPDPFLLAHSYIKEGKSLEKIILYGEQALALDPADDALHLHLFNAYLELSKQEPEKEYTRQAASHLVAAIEKLPTSLENRVWLANYYLQSEPRKAIPVFETFVKTEEQIHRFPEEALTLASLYVDHQQWDKGEELLKKVSTCKQPSAQKAELKLADLYRMRQEIGNAKILYQRLEDSAQREIAYTACLQLARMDFAENPEKNLKKLQSLMARRSLEYEPIHFEAALDYAELKAKTFPEKEQPKQLLQLFEGVKEIYTQQYDVVSKDYHAHRKASAEGDLIYQAYMRYLDARIYLLQAELSHDSLEGKTKKNAARALFSTLKHGKYSVSPYIKEKASMHLYE